MTAPNDLTKSIPARFSEDYARALAGMSESVREAITSDEKLTAIAFGFFKLGFGDGMQYGAQAVRDLMG